MNRKLLELAISLMEHHGRVDFQLPTEFPDMGLGDTAVLKMLAPNMLAKAAHLGADTSLAHMDPPTPEVTWATTMWNASLNQNLLHPAISPFASEAEELCISWLAPYFGMSGGLFCSGSTLGNLTALWAARNYKGVRRVLASELAHNSVPKCCDILGLEYETMATDEQMRAIVPTASLKGCALVLTAGTTGGGAIDPLGFDNDADWIHVDAAWGGALRLSPAYSHLLDGIETADSVSVSAHKMLLQPKDSAFVLFKNYDEITPSIAVSGAYLAKPTVGVQGSRGASATVLLAYLLSQGRKGIEKNVDTLMGNAETLYRYLEDSGRFECAIRPVTGVNVFRPLTISTKEFLASLPDNVFSTFVYQSEVWVRSVSANPNVDVNKIIAFLSDF